MKQLKEKSKSPLIFENNSKESNENKREQNSMFPIESKYYHQ